MYANGITNFLTPIFNPCLQRLPAPGFPLAQDDQGRERLSVWVLFQTPSGPHTAVVRPVVYVIDLLRLAIMTLWVPNSLDLLDDKRMHLVKTCFVPLNQNGHVGGVLLQQLDQLSNGLWWLFHD